MIDILAITLTAITVASCGGPNPGQQDSAARGSQGVAAQALSGGGSPVGAPAGVRMAPAGVPRRTPAALLGAQLATPIPVPTSTPFDITGFLQEAHTGGPDAAGTLTINGQVVVVPASTIVILPANALTWDELFTQAPAPYSAPASGPPETGLAMFDTPAPLTTTEVHVIGNRVTTSPVGDAYIAGLIYLSQQSTNAGAGFINFIDYDAGELRVGGILNDPSTGTRVRINDPAIPDPITGVPGTGRYSKGLTPDRRFTVDQDNPTIISATGYPMCLPRVAPPAPNAPETDPLCPQGNRPPDLNGNQQMKITMPDPATITVPGQLPDPRVQAPFEIGDYIAYAGILVTDADQPTTGPWPGLANTYISAYSIVNNTAIYTAAGTDPAYVEIDVTLVGTGGLSVAGVGEAAVRTRFEGMSTDPTRSVHLYAIDLDPVTGDSTDRDLGTIAVDQVAVPGRWRFVPPCDPFGTTPAKPDKTCVGNQAGTFLPPTREVRAVIEGQQSQLPGLPTAHTAANGIFFGQYHGPVLEYVFPENVPGFPVVPNNFEAIPFLACGGFKSSGGTLAGQLTPWPGLTAPTCANTPVAPTASAGPNQTVPSGATATLAGSATGTGPFSFAWTQTGGPTVALSDPTIAAPTFTAPTVNAATALVFSLTVTSAAGTSTASVTITASAAVAPTVLHVPAQTIGSGTPVTLTATCSDPRGLACTFAWTQTAGTPVVLSPNPKTGASISFTVTLPAGGAATTLQFQIVATNTAGISSAPDTTSVTVTPPADTVTITNVEYRTGKQRLTITATSSVVSPNVNLTLQPYVTSTGATFDPAVIGNLFTNGGAGNYTIQIDGAPEPAPPTATPLTARSSAGGISPPHGIDRLRQ